MHACECGRAYCYSNKWQVGSYIFQFQSMQFESGRTSNNGEWLYTPTGCPPPRVYNTHSFIPARSVVLKCKLSTPSFILSDAWCLTECLTHITEKGCCKADYTRGQSSTTPPSLQSRCHGPSITFCLSPLNVHVPSAPLNISKVSGCCNWMFWTPYGLLVLPPLTARVNELTNITGRLQQTHCENEGMRNNDASTIFNLLV